MQHVEFFDIEHFENNYHRVKPPGAIARFIDFYWETKFDHLWNKFPEGFSDALFPNTGYTYLINLGTPFVMHLDDTAYPMKADCFLPRHYSIECFHRPGNILFGIKFNISPVLFEKKINFSEYTEAVFPLSYLMEKSVITGIKEAGNFAERVLLLNHYFSAILQKSGALKKPVLIVSQILNDYCKSNHFDISIEALASQYDISPRTLQRYFETATSLSSKKTLQILRIRKAVEQLTKDPSLFDYRSYGYYDYSHFCKHLKRFLHKHTFTRLQPHLNLLNKMH